MKEQTAPMSWDTVDGRRYEQSIAHKIPGYDRMHQLMERLLAATLENQTAARLLVTGAGGGKEITLLGKRHPGWTFVGVDPSAPMIRLAQQRVHEAGLESRVQLHDVTLEELQAGDRYDGATSMLMLHFIQGLEAKRRFLNEVANRLKPGAPLIVSSVNADLALPAYPAVMNAWKRHMLEAGVPASDWERFAASLGHESDPVSGEELVRLLRDCGYKNSTRYFGAFWVEGYYAIRA